MKTTKTTKNVQINPFDKVFSLNHVVKIFVPSTIDAIEKTDNTEIVNQIASKLSELNGGATITRGIGCWNSDEFGLIKEDVCIITSNCDKVKYNEVYQIANDIKTSMNQESVAVEIDSVLYLV